MKTGKLSPLLIILFVALILPLTISPYYINLLIIFGIFAILTLSIDIIVGHLGELSLGHAAFFGLGAYTSALLAKNLGLPFWLALPAAAVLSALCGLLIGFITLRLRGAYFALITLAFSEILRLICKNWMGLTNGPLGLPQIPAPAISIPGLFRYEISSEISYYYLTLLLVVGTILLVSRLLKSSTGRAFWAIREQESLARSVGTDTFRYKLLAFSLSTMIAGVAGSAYAHYFQIISPDLLGLYYTATPLMMAFLGGRGTILGPLIGAFIFSIVPEMIHIASSLRLVIFSGLLILSLIFMPDGILKGGHDLWQTVKDKAHKKNSASIGQNRN